MIYTLPVRYGVLGSLDESEDISPNYQKSELLIKNTQWPDTKQFFLETTEIILRWKCSPLY